MMHNNTVNSYWLVLGEFWRIMMLVSHTLMGTVCDSECWICHLHLASGAINSQPRVSSLLFTWPSPCRGLFDTTIRCISKQLMLTSKVHKTLCSSISFLSSWWPWPTCQPSGRNSSNSKLFKTCLVRKALPPSLIWYCAKTKRFKVYGFNYCKYFSIQENQASETLRKDYNLDQSKSNRFHEETTDKLHNLWPLGHPWRAWVALDLAMSKVEQLRPTLECKRQLYNVVGVGMRKKGKKAIWINLTQFEYIYIEIRVVVTYNLKCAVFIQLVEDVDVRASYNWEVIPHGTPCN